VVLQALEITKSQRAN